MQNRRDFLQKVAGALILYGCQNKRNTGRQVVEGEEWRNDDAGITAAGANFKLTEALQEQVNAGIDKHRKGNFTLRFVDKEGQALTGYKLKADLAAHAFDWGQSGARNLYELDERDQKVTKLIRELFNCTTAKCYWDERWHQPIEHEEGRRIYDLFEGEIAWGLANGLRVKGHPLVWTVRKAIPEWMDKYAYQEQMVKLENHVRDLIRVGHQVNLWDLCNEMLWEPSLRHLPQRNWPHLEPIDEILTYLEPAVHWAKVENPNAIYALNDYGLVDTTAPGVTSAQQRSRYVELVQEMHRRGCAPDAMGTQCHVASWYSAQEFTTHLQELSEGGLPIQVTEFWARPKDNPFIEQMNAQEQQQALNDYVEMIYSLAFAHPQVSHVTYWGSREWFDEDGNATPLYQAIYQLIKSKWHTSESMTTNAEGEVAFQGFYGDYKLQITDPGGNMHPAFLNLGHTNKSAEFMLSGV